MSEHILTREIVETRLYELSVIDGELFVDYDTAAFVAEDERVTITCHCGERFRKEETALAHLRSVGALDHGEVAQ